MFVHIFYQRKSNEKAFLITILLTLCIIYSNAQTFTFAQLSGSPVNTTGWNLQGAATIANVTGTGDSEILLCPDQLAQSGAIFYNQPINLSLCQKWTAEFDFRLYDGTGADGLAFCFLDTPPTGFVTGGGLGIPSTANGLKICFDTYPNCQPMVFTDMPKIEIRWGAGYDECNGQPTVDNASNTISFIRSPTYNHAKITYDNGTINVYVNNTFYVTGFQQFNFAGYLGFTAGTGGVTDNHSIKNVLIYTNMPPSDAGPDQRICSGSSIQVGAANNSSYVYNWLPSTGINNTAIADPTITLTNISTKDITQKFYVQTAYATAPGCASEDSVLITVQAALPSVSIVSSVNNICQATPVTFTATPTYGGTSPNYQWKLNGINVGTNNANYTNSTLIDGDTVNCILTSNASCLKIDTAISNTIKMIVTDNVIPSVNITASDTVICPATDVTFTAIPTNGGTSPSYQWQLNGVDVGSDQPTYDDSTLHNGDVVNCTMTSSIRCVTTPTVNSNTIKMVVDPIISPSVSIVGSANNICPDSAVTFTATAISGGTNPSFQWLVNEKNVGSNNAAYTTTSLVNGDTVSCILAGSIPCSLPAVSNNIIMNVYPGAAIDMGPDKVIKYGGSIQLDPIVTGDIATYLWTPDNSLSDPSAINPIANPLATTIYQLSVATIDGCRAAAKTTLNVFIPLQMPTAFTPNGDGMNDVFRVPPFIPLQINYFSVFDRWGNRVFTTGNSNNGWDGTYNSTPQPSGVYIWTIEYKNLLTSKFQKDNGTVILIR